MNQTLSSNNRTWRSAAIGLGITVATLDLIFATRSVFGRRPFSFFDVQFLAAVLLLMALSRWIVIWPVNGKGRFWREPWPQKILIFFLVVVLLVRMGYYTGFVQWSFDHFHHHGDLMPFYY